MRTALLLSVILFVPAIAFSTTIVVPDDFPTIQQAVDAAMAGDTVLVKPGTYVENIDFKGKAITVQSEQGPQLTLIDGGQPVDPDHGSVVTYQTGEGADSILEGFTLTNGKGTLSAPSLHNGGGVYCSAASPSLLDNIITLNSIFGNGGGIFCEKSSSPMIKGNTISWNNTINAYGGGIACFDSSPGIMGNTIEKNAASYGGGVMSYNASHPIVKGNLIEENHADFGGGISCLYGTATILENRIMGNSSFAAGGIDFEGCSSAIARDNLIAENHASIYGGIFCSEVGSVTLTGNTIRENSGNNKGGCGIHCTGCTVASADNVLSGNNNGGGVSFKNSSAMVMNDFIFENLGGGILSEGSDLTILNSTLFGNSKGPGGGIYCTNDSHITVANTILWDNDTSYMGDEITVGDYQTAPATLSISYSDVDGGLGSAYVHPGSTLNWGTGMIDSDPLFVDSTTGDFHLTFNSPCRASGTNAAHGLPGFDFEGDPRIAYGTVDMGADEFYTHLYYTGDAVPGGTVELKFVDLPGASPVGFWIAFNALDTPIPGAYGDWYLLPPMTGPFSLPPIPASGVLVLTGTVPVSPPGPYDLYLQAIMGTPAQLTNLCTLPVQ